MHLFTVRHVCYDSTLWRSTRCIAIVATQRPCTKCYHFKVKKNILFMLILRQDFCSYCYRRSFPSGFSKLEFSLRGTWAGMLWIKINTCLRNHFIYNIKVGDIMCRFIAIYDDTIWYTRRHWNCLKLPIAGDHCRIVNRRKQVNVQPESHVLRAEMMKAFVWTRVHWRLRDNSAEWALEVSQMTEAIGIP